MSVNPKDIPFLPGTIFVDPRKVEYKKAHVFDKNAVTVQIKDDAALQYPQGVTANPLCDRGTVRLDASQLKAAAPILNGMKKLI